MKTLHSSRKEKISISGGKHKSALNFNVANSFAVLHLDPELCKATADRILQQIHKFLQYTEQHKVEYLQSTVKAWECNATSICKMVSLKSLADSLGQINWWQETLQSVTFHG